MAEATTQQVKGFVADVDEFLAKYAKLVSPEIRSKVYATQDPNVIAEYDRQVTTGRALKSSIENVTGAWLAFKREWSKVTDVTSTVIGDAIDEIRSWFGYKPAGDLSAYDVSPISGGQLGRYLVSPISGGQLGMLGALPILSYAVIAGLTAAVITWVKGVDKFFIWLDAWAIKRNDPTISTEQALNKAADIAAKNKMFGDVMPTVALIAAAGIAAYLLFGKKR